MVRLMAMIVAVVACGRLSGGSGRVILAMIARAVAGLCPDQQIPTMLGPAESRRDEVGCQGQADPDERPGRAGRGRAAVRPVVAGEVVHDFRE